jgi:hypothetical protein
MLGEHPIALEKDVLRRRIYAPQAYAPVRNAAVVPIVHSECMNLAAWFPLVWQRRGAAFEFVCVRALVNAQQAQPAPARALLPLRLHAYPFILDPSEPIDANSRKMLDDVFADAPTDVGASITTVQHKLARATTMRFQILDRIAGESGVTAGIAAAIAGRDLFEPWPLKFDIEGTVVEIPDLFIVRAGAFETGVLAEVVERFGPPCAYLLGLHRISLFRAGILLAAARAYFREAKSESDAAPPQATAASVPEGALT